MIEFIAIKILITTYIEDIRKYYTKLIKRGEISLNILAGKISIGAALPTAYIQATLYCLLEINPCYLYAKVDNLGTFYPGLEDWGLEKPIVISSTVTKVKEIICSGFQLTNPQTKPSYRKLLYIKR